jgi:transcriptional regulator with XRE-family HTH domain
MTNHSPIFAKDFAARMSRLGITQEFLARYVGLSQSEISKILSGVRSQSFCAPQINDALRELEDVAECFHPMKPLFDDPDAVKQWISSPSLPRLFSLLSDAQLKLLTAEELTAANAISLECERLEEEIAALHEATRKMFGEWLENPTV